MSKRSEVKKRSRKTEAVAMALCIPEKKTERRVNPVLIARLDEQNVGRR